MKKLVSFVFMFVLSSNIYALNIDKLFATNAYVSSFSNATLFFNLNVLETINVYTSGNTNLFCSISGASNPSNLLFARRMVDLVPISFTAKRKDLYILLCLKSSGFSGDNFLIVERDVIAKRTKTERIDLSEIELIDKAKDIISNIFK